jgi:hypothetical protein
MHIDVEAADRCPDNDRADAVGGSYNRYMKLLVSLLVAG